jgi:hypothetical protein
MPIVIGVIVVIIIILGAGLYLNSGKKQSNSSTVSSMNASTSVVSTGSSGAPINTSYAAQILGDKWIVVYNSSGSVASIDTSSQYYSLISKADFLITNSSYIPYITNISTEVLKNTKYNELTVIKTVLVNSTVASGFMNMEGISFVSGVGNINNLVLPNGTFGIYSTTTDFSGTEVAGAFLSGNYFVEVEFSSSSVVSQADAGIEISELGLDAFSALAASQRNQTNQTSVINTGVWKATTAYPISVSGQSCVMEVAGTILCVGGENNNSETISDVYESQAYGKLYPWYNESPYPINIEDQSCVTDLNNGVYCIGGYSGLGIQTYFNTTSAVYSATPSSPWQLSYYPVPIQQQSCISNNDFVYCIGGYNGTSQLSSTYYAQLNNMKWLPTTPYPIPDSEQSCVTYLNYIYCVGGRQAYYGINNTYFAQLTPLGIGGWNQTTPYPLNVRDTSCTAVSGYIYCIGGINVTNSYNQVYRAKLSSSGIGLWQNVTPYPVNIDYESCVSYNYNATIYCIGGNSTNTYYMQVG